MSAADLVHNRLTNALIDENPTMVTLRRYRMEATPSRGQKKVLHSTLAPQRVRLIANNRQLPERTLPDGRVVRPQKVMLGDMNCDFALGDEFEEGGHTWEIINFDDDAPYRNAAEVVRHGG